MVVLRDEWTNEEGMNRNHMILKKIVNDEWHERAMEEENEDWKKNLEWKELKEHEWNNKQMDISLCIIKKVVKEEKKEVSEIEQECLVIKYYYTMDMNI